MVMTHLTSDLEAWLDARASHLDTTADTAAAVLPKLADAGLFGLGVPCNGVATAAMSLMRSTAIAEVSAHSLTAGFVFWGHRTFIEYLLQSPNAALRRNATAGSISRPARWRYRPVQRDEIPFRH